MGRQIALVGMTLCFAGAAIAAATAAAAALQIFPVADPSDRAVTLLFATAAMFIGISAALTRDVLAAALALLLVPFMLMGGGPLATALAAIAAGWVLLAVSDRGRVLTLPRWMHSAGPRVQVAARALGACAVLLLAVTVYAGIQQANEMTASAPIAERPQVPLLPSSRDMWI